MGTSALEIISFADTILVADLTLVPADEALEPKAWSDPERIAGYPIAGSMQPLDSSAADTLRAIVLDGGNYDPDWHWRCLMQRAVGFRFIRGAARVEGALSDPCWLWIWTFERDSALMRWSATFSESESARIYGLVRPDAATRSAAFGTR